VQQKPVMGKVNTREITVHGEKCIFAYLFGELKETAYTRVDWVMAAKCA
jgi:hypothetical protein